MGLKLGMTISQDEEKESNEEKSQKLQDMGIKEYLNKMK